MRADLYLVEHGFATTRSQAQRLIGSGVQWRVLVNEAEVAAPWKRVAKNGDEIADAAEVEVLDNTEAKYISRGGLKLAGALMATGFDVTGLRCLDIGQSTGGFTDCLLQHGAAHVVGVDVGHGQLHATMRDDTRVVCLEGINARSLTTIDLIASCARFYSEAGRFDAENAPAIEPFFDFLTADLSFISLTLVLPAIVRLLKADGHLLMLVKPQFELQPGQIGKGGIVRDAVHFEFVEKRLRDCCAELGVDVLGWMASSIDGGDGNREFFIHGQKGSAIGLDDKPLPVAPPRKAVKRTPRAETRALHAAHEDSDEAHAGQHGPARRKQRDKTQPDD
jgi:23S rRNA (cytidine1920-2'-O)/16S rRNA (cytidine1409-2'-O)-methyltransferase